MNVVVSETAAATGIGVGTKHRGWIRIVQSSPASRSMTTAVAPTRYAGGQREDVGVLAVAGVVIAFSLSSTLVKRAESPGVLVAVWRLTVATIVWNSFLWSTAGG